MCAQTLLKCAKKLSGYSIGEIAHSLAQPISNYSLRNKGFVGKLLEIILGSYTVTYKQCVDFPNLGVELKSIPIDHYGHPLESTFICNVQLIHTVNVLWEQSYFYNKIKKILWIPIVGNKNTSLSHRIIGDAFIWKMNNYETKIIKEDWEEFMDLIFVGNIANISSECGRVIQLKKKCKNNTVLTKSINYDGYIKLINPRAFYFRKTFTWTLFNQYQK